MDDGGSIFAQEEQLGPHSEAPEELAEDDTDELRLREVLGTWLVEKAVEVVVEVVVGSSSSSSIGVPSSSMMIGMSGSVQPGGNAIEPGG